MLHVFHAGTATYYLWTGSGMFMSDNKNESVAEGRRHPRCMKSEIFAEFFREYGEHAGWDEWLAFLEERPELKGFEWARSLADRHSS